MTSSSQNQEVKPNTQNWLGYAIAGLVGLVIGVAASLGLTMATAPEPGAELVAENERLQASVQNSASAKRAAEQKATEQIQDAKAATAAAEADLEAMIERRNKDEAKLRQFDELAKKNEYLLSVETNLRNEVGVLKLQLARAEADGLVKLAGPSRPQTTRPRPPKRGRYFTSGEQVVIDKTYTAHNHDVIVRDLKCKCIEINDSYVEYSYRFEVQGFLKNEETSYAIMLKFLDDEGMVLEERTLAADDLYADESRSHSGTAIIDLKKAKRVDNVTYHID